MSNTRRIKDKVKKLRGPRCPKCQTKGKGTEYSDAILYICPKCKFPWRVKHRG